MSDHAEFSNDYQVVNALYEEACLKQLLWIKAYQRFGWTWLKVLSDNWELVAKETLQTMEVCGQVPHNMQLGEFVGHIPNAIEIEALSECTKRLNTSDLINPA